MDSFDHEVRLLHANITVSSLRALKLNEAWMLPRGKYVKYLQISIRGKWLESWEEFRENVCYSSSPQKKKKKNLSSDKLYWLKQFMNFRYKVNFKKEELGLLKVDGNQQYQRHDMTLAEEKMKNKKKLVNQIYSLHIRLLCFLWSQSRFRSWNKILGLSVCENCMLNKSHL